MRRGRPATRTAAAVLAALALAAAAAGCGGSAHTAKQPPAPPPQRSPFAHVNWGVVPYPLACGGAGTLAGRVVEVHVSGRSDPLAVVMVTCRTGKLSANLFAFEPGPQPLRPHLVQQLTPARFDEQPISLAASQDRVVLRSAGYAAADPDCCPTADRVRRWTWDGSRFRPAHVVPITRIVVPDVTGMPFDAAGAVLVRHGILFYGWRQLDPSKPEPAQRVVRTEPPAGSVLHPPGFHVTVVTR